MHRHDPPFRYGDRVENTFFGFAATVRETVPIPGGWEVVVESDDGEKHRGWSTAYSLAAAVDWSTGATETVVS